MTLETLLSDDFNATTCTTDDELEYLDSTSWQLYLSLVPVEEVTKDYPGSGVATLRRLTTALAREVIFGKEEMCRSSLSGRKILMG